MDANERARGCSSASPEALSARHPPHRDVLQRRHERIAAEGPHDLRCSVGGQEGVRGAQARRCRQPPTAPPRTGPMNWKSAARNWPYSDWGADSTSRARSMSASGLIGNLLALSSCESREEGEAGGEGQREAQAECRGDKQPASTSSGAAVPAMQWCQRCTDVRAARKSLQRVHAGGRGQRNQHPVARRQPHSRRSWRVARRRGKTHRLLVHKARAGFFRRGGSSSAGARARAHGRAWQRGCVAGSRSAQWERGGHLGAWENSQRLKLRLK